MLTQNSQLLNIRIYTVCHAVYELIQDLVDCESIFIHLLNIAGGRTKYRKVHKVPQGSTRYRTVDNNTVKLGFYLVTQGW